MNCYPYDGKSQTLIVVDKQLVSRSSVTNPYLFDKDVLYRVLDELGLLGCYVTDSSDSIPPDENRRIFGGPSHLEDELIYVHPTKIISIGKKSEGYVSQTLQDWPGDRPSVIQVLKTTEEIVDRTQFADQLRTELKTSLGPIKEERRRDSLLTT
jgi:hypothetical protein